jgi:hypothetical protein
MFRDDSDKNNPKDRLDRIIKNLETLHKDICKSIEAASFNHYIDEIDTNLLDMATNAFSICHLIIEGVNQKELQADEFLDPHHVDVKVQAIMQLTMGQWIKITLETLGIKSNNFQSDGNVIDLDSIAGHLNQDFSQIILNTTGLHEFIRNNPNKSRKENEEFSKKILFKVINIHREILKIYYVKSSLVHAARVGVNLGESWLYGNEDGKLVVSALLTVIKDASDQFKKIIEDFWGIFYEDTYMPYSRINGFDNRNPTFKFLYEAKERFDRIDTCHGIIGRSLTALAEKASSFANDAEVTKQSKRVLINNLYDFLRRKSGVDENLIRGLGRLVQSENSATARANAPVITVAPLIIEPHIVRYPIARFPIYQTAKRLLVDKVALEPHEQLLTLMERPISRPRTAVPTTGMFHTDLQQSIYDDILEPLHSIVKAGWWYSQYYSITTFPMDELRKFYSRINKIMTALYEPATLSRARPDIRRVAGATQAQIEADVVNEIPCDNLVNEEHVFYNLNKGSVTLWTTELMIVDQHLKIALYHFSKIFKANNNPFSSLLPVNDYEILQIEPVGDNLEISIDERLLTFAGGAFAIELEKVKQRLADSEAANTELCRQIAIFGDKNRNLSSELERANSDVASRDAIIARLEEQCRAYEASAVASAGTNPNRFFASGDSSQAASSGTANLPR